MQAAKRLDTLLQKFDCLLPDASAGASEPGMVLHITVQDRMAHTLKLSSRDSPAA